MSDSVYRRLLAAGAPELPADHFYRIHRTSPLGVIQVVAQVRRRRWVKVPLLGIEDYLPWTKRLSIGRVNVTIDETPMQAVVRACSIAAREADVDNETAKFLRTLDGLMGDHP